MFDGREELAYKVYRFEKQGNDFLRPISLIYTFHPSPEALSDLIGCQTTLSVEIIFSLILELTLMRFQFMSRRSKLLTGGFIINELS